MLLPWMLALCARSGSGDEVREERKMAEEKRGESEEVVAEGTGGGWSNS